MTQAMARKLLGVEPGAGEREVERAFRRLARLHHPDRGGDPACFVELAAARERLLRPTPAESRPVVVRRRRWRRAVRVLQRRRFQMRQPRSSDRVR